MYYNLKVNDNKTLPKSINKNLRYYITSNRIICDVDTGDLRVLKDFVDELIDFGLESIDEVTVKELFRDKVLTFDIDYDTIVL